MTLEPINEPLIDKSSPSLLHKILIQGFLTLVVITSALITITWRDNGKHEWRGFKAITTTVIVMLANVRSFSSTRSSHTYQFLIKMGLLAGLCGDIFLSYEGKPFFILGLCFFLSGHVFFVVAFLANPKRNMRFVAFLLLMDLTYIGLIIRHASWWLKIPGVCYLLTISVMIYASLNRFVTSSKRKRSSRLGTLLWLGVSFSLLQTEY
ncbi:hypothetical protein GEMRC1_010554 [Eukaryota sp. GEM-RC1]